MWVVYGHQKQILHSTVSYPRNTPQHVLQITEAGIYSTSKSEKRSLLRIGERDDTTEKSGVEMPEWRKHFLMVSAETLAFPCLGCPSRCMQNSYRLHNLWSIWGCLHFGYQVTEKWFLAMHLKALNDP
jgi:hypothetical protein